MARQTKQQQRYEQNMARIKREKNPCPGRTNAERDFITRRLIDIDDSLNHHLSRLARSGDQPAWLPTAVITPSSEADYVESKDAFETAPRNDDGYILQMHDHNQKATNRIRVATWYRNDNQDLYMLAKILISPLPSDEWGALPLSLGQWRQIIASMTITHMEWTWVHAVRQYWGDDTWQVGGTFGWYMEKCKVLDDSGFRKLWTGQVTYEHAVRAYSEHVQLVDTQCRQS